MNNYSIYGAACDSLFGYIYWHSQEDPGTGFNCQLSRMDLYTMDSVGTPFGFVLPPGLTDGIAGGLCSWNSWPWGCVLYALIQGTPHDYIVGVIGGGWENIVEAQHASRLECAHGLSLTVPAIAERHVAIDYATESSGRRKLMLYDCTGRLVRTLVDGYEQGGAKRIKWDGTDSNNRKVACGVYILRLEVEGRNKTGKVVFMK
jgi:hypothetical protein